MSVTPDRPAVDPLALMNARLFLEGVSAQQRALFGEDPDHRLHCRIGRSRTVHPVKEIDWLGGVQLLVPACRVGFAGWRLDRMQPVDNPDPDTFCARPACRAELRSAHRAAPLSGRAAKRAQNEQWEQGLLPLTLPQFASA